MQNKTVSQSLVYGGGVTVLCPHQTLKIKNVQTALGSGVRGGKGLNLK